MCAADREDSVCANVLGDITTVLQGEARSPKGQHSGGLHCPTADYCGIGWLQLPHQRWQEDLKVPKEGRRCDQESIGASVDLATRAGYLLVRHHRREHDRLPHLLHGPVPILFASLSIFVQGMG